MAAPFDFPPNPVEGATYQPPGGSVYSFHDGVWRVLANTGIADAPSDNLVYGRRNATWLAVGGGIPEPTNDGKVYVRKTGIWVEASDKTAVDTALSGKVSKAGDTMLGSLLLPAGDPVLDTQAVHKKYVDTAVSGASSAANAKVSKAGDTMTGVLTLPPGNAAAPSVNFGTANSGVHGSGSSVLITAGGLDNLTVSTTNVSSAVPVVLPANPTADSHAANKIYVDQQVATKIGDSVHDSRIYGRQNGTWVQVTGGGGGGGSVVWDDILLKPDTFPPSPHFHVISDVTNLSASLSAKVDRDGGTMIADPVVPLGVATKAYVDTKVGGAYTEAEADAKFVDVAGDTMTGPLAMPLGLVSAPSLTFTGDSNTGFFSPSADQISVVTGGATKMLWSLTAAYVYVPILSTTGSVASPAYSFSGDTDTGVYRVAADTLGFSTGATLRLSVSTTDITSTLPIVLPGNPSTALQAAPKQYVDTKEPLLPAGGTTSNFLRGDKTWAAVPAAGVPEAPTDGQLYSRRGSDATWQLASAGGGGTAASVVFTPAGNISAINVQTAIQELDTEKVAKAGDTMTGVLLHPNGTAALPSIAFANSTTTGFYRVGTDTIGIATAGIGRVTLDSANLVSTVNIVLPGNPTSGLQAATKQYVDTAAGGAYTKAQSDAQFVDVAGDTMTGHLSLPTGPAAANAVRKDYVDAADATLTTSIGAKVAKNGDTMTGALTLPADPTNPLHAATKQYVDAKPSGATISDTAPGSPAAGQLWWESDTGVLALYYNDGNTSQWVGVGGTGLPEAPVDGKGYLRRNNGWSLGLTQTDGDAAYVKKTGDTMTGNLALTKTTPILSLNMGLSGEAAALISSV